jgi:hypothetical protein
MNALSPTQSHRNKWEKLFQNFQPKNNETQIELKMKVSFPVKIHEMQKKVCFILLNFQKIV